MRFFDEIFVVLTEGPGGEGFPVLSYNGTGVDQGARGLDFSPVGISLKDLDSRYGHALKHLKSCADQGLKWKVVRYKRVEEVEQEIV